MNEANKRFREIIKRQHEIDKAVRLLKLEHSLLDSELIGLSGVKVGSVVDQGHMKVSVLDIVPDVYFIDHFAKDVVERVCLQVRGHGTPITAKGAPHKTIRWQSWSVMRTDICMTQDEYFTLRPKGE